MQSLFRNDVSLKTEKTMRKKRFFFSFRYWHPIHDIAIDVEWWRLMIRSMCSMFMYFYDVRGAVRSIHITYIPSWRNHLLKILSSSNSWILEFCMHFSYHFVSSWYFDTNIAAFSCSKTSADAMPYTCVWCFDSRKWNSNWRKKK